MMLSWNPTDGLPVTRRAKGPGHTLRVPKMPRGKAGRLISNSELRGFWKSTEPKTEMPLKSSWRLHTFLTNLAVLTMKPAHTKGEQGKRATKKEREREEEKREK